VTRIERESTVTAQPYANMLPIIDFLLRLGNVALDGGFIMNPDGWRCRLASAIDFNAVKREFDLPASINDSVYSLDLPQKPKPQPLRSRQARRGVRPLARRSRRALGRQRWRRIPIPACIATWRRTRRRLTIQFREREVETQRSTMRKQPALGATLRRVPVTSR
jgi:hypothetical protein